MSGGILFLIGTIAAWVGWTSLAFAVYRLVDVLMKPAGLARSRSVKAFIASGITSAICLLFAAALPMNSGRGASGWVLPVFWPIFPFAVWASLFCLCFAGYRAFQLLVDRPASTQGETSFQKANVRLWIRQGVIALAGCIAFFLIYRKMGDTVAIVKGGIAFTPGTAIAIILCAILAVVIMAIAGQYSLSRGIAKKFVLHLMLLVGSLVFGLPFFWLVITSFKEDRDMSSPNGLVWIPKVSETVPYRDPDNPYYQADYQNQTVEADLVKREPGGKVILTIDRPRALIGFTFEALQSQVKEIDREVPVMTGTYRGQPVQGDVIKDMNDGRQLVLITKPQDLAGSKFAANPSDLEPVRHVGLKWSNYPDSLQYLPAEAHLGLTYLQNTLILVFFNILGTILSSSIVAYAFARMKFPGKGLLFTVLISTMMLPAAVTLLPTFLIFKTLGWVDTLYPLWVPAFFASAFNVFLLRQFFMTVPKELEDASKIDGCSYLKTFWSVMLPQVKPALAVIAIWTFMAVWNNFMGPLVYINSPEHMPISYALQLFQGDRQGEPGLLMAFTTMSMLPVLALFFGAQKYFIDGVTLSGLGGR